MVKAVETAAVEYSFAALNSADATKAIKSIITRGGNLRKSIHETAVGLLMHFEAHGDSTKMIQLAGAIAITMSESMKKLYIEWVIKHSQLSYDQKAAVEGSKVKGNFVTDRTKVSTLEEAMKTPFWIRDKADNSTPYDFQKAITTLLEGALKKVEADKVNQADKAFIAHMAKAAEDYKNSLVVVKPAKAKKAATNVVVLAERQEEVAA